jgi:hypothetical protein
MEIPDATDHARRMSVAACCGSQFIARCGVLRVLLMLGVEARESATVMR